MKLSRMGVSPLLLLVALLLGACSSFKLNPTSLDVTSINLPQVQGDLTFGDIVYNPRLKKVLVPSGADQLFLIDPESRQVSVFSGLGSSSQPGEIVSVASGSELLFLLDQGMPQIIVVEPGSGTVVASVSVSSRPDHILFIPTTNELWVTEPDLEQIEVFQLSEGSPPQISSEMVIPVPDGVEGLLLDRGRGLVFTNLPAIGLTAVIQDLTHSVIDRWGNGCTQARGMAVDVDRGYLFVACREGKLVLLDINNNGTQVTSVNYGGQLDQVAYNPQLKHVYLPSGESAIMAIYSVQEQAIIANTQAQSETSTAPAQAAGTQTALVRLGTADTALNSTCVAADDLDNIWLCDPERDRVLLVKDTFTFEGE